MDSGTLSKMTSNIFLNYILKGFSEFSGVFSADNPPRIKPVKNGVRAFIINTVKSSESLIIGLYIRIE